MTYITIGFSKAKGFMPFSDIIRKVQKTPFSHTYIKVYNTDYNEYDVYQASKGLVNHMTYSSFLEHNEVCFEIDIPVSNYKIYDIIGYVRNRLGKAYSFRTCFVIYLSHVFGTKKFDIFLDGEKRYICSELVARALESSNITHLGFPLDKATPKQLFDFLNNKYN